MPKSKLTAENISFIRQYNLQMSGCAMAKLFGVNRNIVNRYMRNNGLSVSRELKNKFRAAAHIGKTSFTKQEDAFIKANYLKFPVKVLGAKIGRSYTGVMGRFKALGIKLPDTLINQRKEDSRIKKGNVPPNKGKKQTDYMSAEAISKSAAHRYKKGNLPANTKSDFEISIRADNRGVNYKFIRIGLSNWIPLHRYNWQKANGPIPRNMKLIFKDRDPMNCDISNLELLSPGQLMKRNSLHNYPPEIKQTIQLSGVLTRKINKKLKQLQNEK